RRCRRRSDPRWLRFRGGRRCHGWVDQGGRERRLRDGGYRRDQTWLLWFWLRDKAAVRRVELVVVSRDVRLGYHLRDGLQQVRPGHIGIAIGAVVDHERDVDLVACRTVFEVAGQELGDS